MLLHHLDLAANERAPYEIPLALLSIRGDS